MSLIRVKVMTDVDWSLSDRVELWLGSENAASLAASTPSGGRMVLEVPAWGDAGVKGGFGADPFGGVPFGFSQGGYGFGLGEFGFGAFGTSDVPRVRLEYHYPPSDKCATLPVGVKVRDLAGNRSNVIETIATFHAPPRPARRLTVHRTLNILEALLRWEASPDVA